VKALREAGFTARIEEPGYMPAGERWEADVLLECAGRKIAIEVQVSPQTFDKYERRSEKYIQSGVKVV
jgi:competence CoiA-like predicted nuclease